MDINEENEKFTDKIKKLVPDDDQRNLFIATLLGTSAVLAEFIMTNIGLKDLSIDVKYACALTAANMVAFITDGEKGKIVEMEQTNYEMGEQTQERIYRKMKWIIEKLHNDIQEQEKI